ncbi:MAG: hypothetical protein GEV04_08205 [Actinophytocola sp.]|nr:hypothetical protein [Actinophytocola sp.]
MVTTQRRLRGRLRKGVLLVHIISVGAWFGIDVVLAVLVFTALLTDDTGVAVTSLAALELFAVWPMLVASLLSLASGIVLGLGSKWGILRYWWVLVKLVINVGMSALIVFALRPGIGDAAEYAGRLAAGDATATMPEDLIFPPIVSPTLLLIAFTLSVLKPWGRVRASSPPPRVASEEIYAAA